MIESPLLGDIEQRSEWKSERHIDQGSRSLAVPPDGLCHMGVWGAGLPPRKSILVCEEGWDPAVLFLYTGENSVPLTFIKEAHCTEISYIPKREAEFTQLGMRVKIITRTSQTPRWVCD